MFTILTLLILVYHSSSVSEALAIANNILEAWCKQHDKTYASEEEKALRLKVLEDNNEFVNKHNSMADASYTLALNAFVDLKHHEFRFKSSMFQPLWIGGRVLERSQA